MQIIRRTRLGNDTEDITFPSTQLRSNNVTIMDGYEVLGLPLSTAVPPAIVQSTAGAGSQAVQTAPSTTVRQAVKLFDVLGLKLKGGPRGITYADSQSLFVFNDPTQIDTLFLADTQGQPRRTIVIQYLNDETPQAIEGLGYIPRTATQFPDHLVMVTSFPDPDNGIQARLEIINFKGQVAREIVPQGDLASVFLTGVCFKSPDSLLVSSDDDEVVYELDFDGNQLTSYNLTGTPATPAPVLHGVEGVVQTTGGQIAAASGFDGMLAIFDLRSGVRQTQVIDYRIGLGLSLPTGLGWDSLTNQFLLISFDRQQPDDLFISRVDPLLASFKSVVGVDAQTRKLTFLPDENLLAATHNNNPRGILLFDKKGGQAGTIDTTQFGTPQVISYIPTTREFVLVFRDTQDASKRNKLFVLTRQGAVSRIIDLAAAGVNRITAVTFFNPQHPTGGQFLVIDGAANTAVVTDFNGNKPEQFSVRDAFGLLTPSAVTSITTGTDAGALAIINAESSELVVFRLD